VRGEEGKRGYVCRWDIGAQPRPAGSASLGFNLRSMTTRKASLHRMARLSRRGIIKAAPASRIAALPIPRKLSQKVWLLKQQPQTTYTSLTTTAFLRTYPDLTRFSGGH
jgi:hypothetical protein